MAVRQGTQANEALRAAELKAQVRDMERAQKDQQLLEQEVQASAFRDEYKDMATSTSKRAKRRSSSMF
jgi:hypothetical protein